MTPLINAAWWQSNFQRLSYESRAQSAAALARTYFGDQALSGVLDIGCGAQYLRKILRQSEYVGLDIAVTSQDALVCDLSLGIFPTLPRPVTSSFMIGVAEYLINLSDVYRWLRTQSQYLLTTYDKSKLVSRRVNNYSHDQVETMLNSTGWNVIKRHGFWFICRA
jgi:hypothetical protein